jgi:hypothetical protein
MQRGLPVICSRNGGLDEILEGYKYKFNPYIEGELETQIEAFMQDGNEEIEKQQKILIQILILHLLLRRSSQDSINQLIFIIILIIMV